MTQNPRWWLRIPGLLACGVAGVSGQWFGSRAEAAGLGAQTFASEVATVEGATFAADSFRTAIDIASPAGAPEDGIGARNALRSDLRVRAFVRAYGSLIDSVSYRDDDVIFTLRGRAIHFQDGRMSASDRLDRRDRCDSIFYRYPLERPTEPAAPSSEPVRFCTDVQEVLWGRTEDQIREHARATTFLDHRMFLNDLVAEALEGVERDVVAAAAVDPAVASWIDDVDITYSFIDRGIAGTATRSQHAWGLAVDLVPASYEGRQVYWRWSRAWNPRGWHRIPLEQRWSPPDAVIEIFERHGFVWGGKWARFDNIHFEYRPEIIEYNRLIEAEGSRGR